MKDVIVVFIFSFIYYFSKYQITCSPTSTINFDSQNFLTWDFSSFSNLIPYKDVFYPYGILDYYKRTNIFIHNLHLIIIVLLITFFFVHIKLLFKSRFFSYVGFILFVVFINNFISVEVFHRYGIVVVFSLSVAYLLAKDLFFNNKFLLLSGLILGFTTSLINDAGIYSGITLFTVILIYFLLSHNPELKLKQFSYKRLFTAFFTILIGFIIGFSPFVIYLINNKSFLEYLIITYRTLSLSEYAKIPFLTYATSKENIFLFISLFISVNIVIYKTFYVKGKKNLLFYYQLILLLNLILLEQKNIIRPNAGQLTFVGLLLSFTFWKDLEILFSSFQISRFALRAYFLILVSLFSYKFNLLESYKILLKDITSSYTQVERIKKIFYTQSDFKICLNNYFIISKNSISTTYFEVKEKIKRDFGYKGKIYSFPNDPIYYILFNQTPAPYFNLYDASPIFAQNANIEYIEKNNINYVIYNLSIPTIDSVPVYLRGDKLYSYILNNFSITDRVENFLILKRANSENDFIKESLKFELSDLNGYLLNVNLGDVPRIEGKYFRNSQYKKFLISSSSINQINDFLKRNLIHTDRLLIQFKPIQSSNNEWTTFSMKTKDSYMTNIMMRGCNKYEICVLDVSYIPLFFKSRILSGVVISEYSGEISLVRK